MFGFNYVACISVQGFCYVAGLFAVLGHVFPVYYKFKGGKGVLVTSTMALILTPIQFLILFGIFVAIVGFSKYVSLGSVSVALLYPVLVNASFVLLFKTPADILISGSAAVLGCMITILHFKNLKRIGERTENKLSFKKKKNDD